MTTTDADLTLTPDQARPLARDAWLFGMPLVYIGVQIDTATHVARPDGLRAPINQLVHFRQFPDAANKLIVGLNVDTLYTLANLDLARGPMVLSVPPMGERFWVMQFVDAWNNVPHAPGSRTLGGKGGDFAIVGPDWTGAIPSALTQLRIPTNLVSLGGRIYTAGKADYAAVHALQDQFRMTPLSAWGGAYTPPDNAPLKAGVDIKTPVPSQVLAMSPQAFFERLNSLLVANPPEPADPATMARIARLGVGPGAAFRMDAFSKAVRTAIEEGVADAQKLLPETPRGDLVNGWQVTLDMGRYGTNYPYRAAWTFYGVGGNLAEDAVYPFAEKDGADEALNAANNYVLTFAKGQTPPVEAFWSLTLYGADSYLCANAIDRYALGDRSNLTFDADGSLSLYIQSQSPGADRQANWLPAPKKGRFELALRLYAPKREVADRTWSPPPIRKAS